MWAHLTSGIAGLALVAVVGAPQPVAEPPMRFASTTELVLIDFVVLDSGRRTVEGLTANDVVVKEDGRPRPIVHFEAFSGVGGAASSDRRLTVDAERTTAGLAPRPVTALLVDDHHLSPSQAGRLRSALKHLLARLGTRNGRLMLVAPASRVSVAADVPDATGALSDATDRILGHRPDDHSRLPVSDSEAVAIVAGDPSVLFRVSARFGMLNPEFSDTTARMLAQSRANEVAHTARKRRDVTYGVAALCLDWLGRQAGRRNLVLVSPGFVREPVGPEYHELLTRSLRVNAPVHFLDARELPGGPRYDGVEHGPSVGFEAREEVFAWSDAAAGAARLAADTGGITVDPNDVDAGLYRLIDMMASYYVLAYEVPATGKPGFRAIRVEVKRKGLKVLSRRGYLAERPVVP